MGRKGCPATSRLDPFVEIGVIWKTLGKVTADGKWLIKRLKLNHGTIECCLSSGGYKKNTINWVGYKQQKFISQNLEAQKSKIKILTDFQSGQGPLPGSQMAVFSLCPHSVEG